VDGVVNSNLYPNGLKRDAQNSWTYEPVALSIPRVDPGTTRPGSMPSSRFPDGSSLRGIKLALLAIVKSILPATKLDIVFANIA
jgi:hypothetical protein